MRSTLLLILTVGIVLVAIAKPGKARYIPRDPRFNGGYYVEDPTLKTQDARFMEGGYYVEDPTLKTQDARFMEGGYYAQDMDRYNQKG